MGGYGWWGGGEVDAGEGSEGVERGEGGGGCRGVWVGGGGRESRQAELYGGELGLEIDAVGGEECGSHGGGLWKS